LVPLHATSRQGANPMPPEPRPRSLRRSATMSGLLRGNAHPRAGVRTRSHWTCRRSEVRSTVACRVGLQVVGVLHGRASVRDGHHQAARQTGDIRLVRCAELGQFTVGLTRSIQAEAGPFELVAQCSQSAKTRRDTTGRQTWPLAAGSGLSAQKMPELFVFCRLALHTRARCCVKSDTGSRAACRNGAN
jgi:hypothetical protein